MDPALISQQKLKKSSSSWNEQKNIILPPDTIIAQMEAVKSVFYL
jgi:hypothetical protein